MAQSRKQKVLQEVKRKRQQRTIASLAIAIVLVAVIGGVVYAVYRNAGNGGNFPFPCLAESTNLHVHPWLRVWINTGTTTVNVTIPVAVGISDPQYSTSGGEQVAAGGACFEPLHTHDASGIIHVESALTSDTYTLGDFFNIWKVSFNTVNVNGVSEPVIFNQTDILGHKAGGGHSVVLLVDGQTSNAYGSLVLNKLDYCSSTMTSPPCYPTASGDPQYGGSPYPYGTGHTIVIEYT